MLCIIIVPRNNIIIQEGEQLVFVLLKSLLVGIGYITLIYTLGQIVIETPNAWFMFL